MDEWDKTSPEYDENMNFEMSKWVFISSCANFGYKPGSVGGPRGLSSGFTTKGGSTTKMYRAVDDFELQKLSENKTFESHNNSPGRFFAKSKSDAHWYGKKIYGPGNYTVIEATFTGYSGKYWQQHSDIGAFWFPKPQLPNIKLVNF